MAERIAITEDELTYLLFDRLGCAEVGKQPITAEFVERTLLEARRLARLMLASEQMYEALNNIKKMLGVGGDYSVCRSNHEPMGLGEVMTVGQIFENADSALAAAEGRK